MLLEFADEQQFRAWATSSDYTAIAGDRLAATTGNVLLISGSRHSTKGTTEQPTPETAAGPGPTERDTDTAPAGFEPAARTGPLIDLLGPLYTREDADDGIVLGLRTTHHHTNARGLVHGAVSR